MGKQHRFFNKHKQQHAAKSQELGGNAEGDVNPYELKFARPKHHVLGRRVKGAMGKPAATRKRSEETRKQTLLVELESKNRASQFVDRRFGENDPSISLEDKMLERFVKEKTKRSERSSAFNLEDEDELTHMGQSLSNLDSSFARFGSDSEDEGNIDFSTVDRDHFGGFEEAKEEGDRKSKSEIMKEVIAKSKFHKYERQKQAEENMQLAMEVDAELDSIWGLLGKKAKATEENQARPAEDDYDRMVRELAFDKRARPSNRMKSEAEVAMEAKQELERREAERQKRMRPVEEQDALEDEETNSKKRRRLPQADDLGDDNEYLGGGEDSRDADGGALVYREGVLVNDEIFMRKRKKGAEGEDGTGAKGGADVEEDEYADSDDEDEDEEDEEDDEEEEDEDEDESEDDEETAEMDAELVLDGEDEEEDGSEAEGDENEGDGEDYEEGKNDLKSEGKGSTTSTSKQTSQPEPVIPNLPYTFPAPSTHEAFLEIVQDRTPEELAQIVHRIRVLYHVSLHAHNKSKLETLFRILLRHVTYCSQQPKIASRHINALGRHIFEMAQQFPELATNEIGGRLDSLQNKIGGASKYPRAPGLILLKLIGTVFSVSDYQHPIVTPAVIFMASCLSRGATSIKDARDVVAGLFMCRVLHEYHTLSKRYIPETITFLSQILVSCLPKKTRSKIETAAAPTNSTSTKSTDSSGSSSSLSLTFPVPSPTMLSMLSIRNAKAAEGEGKDGEVAEKKMGLDMLKEFASGQQVDDEFRLSVLRCTLSLLQQYAQLYRSNPSAIEIFKPIVQILDICDAEADFGTSVQELMKKARNAVQTIVFESQHNRKPLQLQKRKPVPIATYVPKFQENYSIDRKHDRNRQRSEMSKLRKQHSQEMKGARRELRKDADFIARQKLKAVRERDAEYKKRINGIVGQLADQEGAMRGYERAKKR
ncbi:nucleolar complex protein 14 [Quaeritorhiza haematococci]|nr:nucleolar complex protein 14 [Quaeritorhiza haematococci]